MEKKECLGWVVGLANSQTTIDVMVISVLD